MSTTTGDSLLKKTFKGIKKSITKSADGEHEITDAAFFKFREEVNKRGQKELTRLWSQDPKVANFEIIDFVTKASWDLLATELRTSHTERHNAENYAGYWRQKLEDDKQLWEIEKKQFSESAVTERQRIDREHASALKNLEDSLRSRWENEDLQRQREIQRLENEKSQLIAGHHQAMQAERQRFEKEREKLLQTHTRELRNAHDQTMAAKEAARKEKYSLQQQHENDTQKRSQEHNRELLQAEAVQQNLETKHTAVVTELKRSHESAISELRGRNKSAVEQMIAEHKSQQAKLTQSLNESSEALLARDDENYASAIFSTAHLPKTSDEYVKNQFLGVNSLVDDLSRVKWKEDRQLWNDDVLAKLGQSNIRILRKSIIQDFIWTTLQEHVYCSPFRLFGSEGLELEREWVERCHSVDGSSDSSLASGEYLWPKPTIRTERWRYFTVHGCKEALKAKPSARDTRTYLKNDFNRNLVETVKKIDTFLKSLTYTSSETMKAIKELLKNISEMWLEFGMNRCRLMIFLEGIAEPKSVTEKMAEAESGFLRLVTMPGVRRFGNEKGEHLEHMTIVEGCEGKTITFSPSTGIQEDNA